MGSRIGHLGGIHTPTMKQPTSITIFPYQQAKKSPQNHHVLSFNPPLNPLFVASKEKTPEPGQVPGSGGGGWGIRTPEGLHPTRFPSVRHRPLGESSVHIVPDNHKRKKPPSANPGQWTRSQARNPTKNRAPRQAGKQASTHPHLPRITQAIQWHRNRGRAPARPPPAWLHPRRPTPKAAPASCESEEPERVDGQANEDEDAVVDEGGDGLA